MQSDVSMHSEHGESSDGTLGCDASSNVSQCQTGHQQSITDGAKPSCQKPSNGSMAADDSKSLLLLQLPEISVSMHEADHDYDGDDSSISHRNYHTVSGIKAQNILKDLNQKYKSSERASLSGAGKEGKSTNRKISFGQGNIFGFKSKKEKPEPVVAIQQGSWHSDSKHENSTFRRSSDPIEEMDVDEKPKGKMWNFLESLRPRSKSINAPSPVPSNKSAVGTNHGAQMTGSVAGKGKRFVVTATNQPKKNLEIGPNEFFAMYRQRALSDTKSPSLLSALEAARNKKVSDHTRHFSGGNEYNDFDEESKQLRVLVWRDRRSGTKIFRLPSPSTNEKSDEFKGREELAYARFLNENLCYDLMPYSSKLVVFDTKLTVKKAFFALVQNGVKAAVLWDTLRQDFVGMLTVTDFIEILQKYYVSPDERISDVEEQEIYAWKEALHHFERPVISTPPEATLLEAVQSLCHNKVHRLLVVDKLKGNALNILTHKRILKFLHMHMEMIKTPSFMKKTLSELEIGTFDNIAVITPDTTLIQALKLFMERRISALPIVDKDGRILDIFAKFDFAGLAHDKLHNNLDLTIEEAVKNRREGFEGVHVCKMNETLEMVVNRIVSTAVHRLVVVDHNNRVVGIMSLSDILQFLVLEPFEHDSKRGSGMKSTPEELQTRESVEPTHNPDEQTHNPNEQTHNPDEQTHNPDEQMHNPIEQTYNPPEVESL